MKAIIFALVFWCLSGSAAFAGWVEVKSENFTFVGETSEKKAKSIVKDLEQYRSIIFKVLGMSPEPEIMPVRIYAAKSDKAFGEMTGSKNLSGVYSAKREGPVFVLKSKGDLSIAYHEYTHHIIANYSNRTYPRWYNEGYAEYLSTFSLDKKNRFKIGLPNEGRAYALLRPWMLMDVLTGSIRSYPYRNDGKKGTRITQSQFYAQSWLAVHYIQSTPEFAKNITAYLDAVDSGGGHENVFEKSFGVTPEAFGKLLKAYHKKNRYSTMVVTLNEKVEQVEMSLREISKAEAYFHRAEVIRMFRGNDTGRALAEKYYTRSEEQGGPLAQIAASRAWIANSTNDHTKAQSQINTALALDSNDSRILQIASLVYLESYRNKNGARNFADIEKSRSYAKQAMRANPSNVTAHFYYVSTYAAANDKPSKQAISSADECALYYRANNFIGGNMRLAEVLVKSGNGEKARTILKKAKTWSSSPITRNRAKRELTKLGG